MELSIVVPCYNEEAVIQETAARLLQCIADLVAAGKVVASSRIYFVDDGRSDRTWPMIKSLALTACSKPSR